MPRRKPEIKNSGILWDHICNKVLFHNYMEDQEGFKDNSFGIHPRSAVGEKMSKKLHKLLLKYDIKKINM